MTKKRSLLLTGLFAVSGILPCHARQHFGTLGPWSDRQTLFNNLGLGHKHRGVTDGSKWHNSTTMLFDNLYQPTTNKFKDLVNDFNSQVSALAGNPIKLPNDGTDLHNIQLAAETVVKDVLSDQTVENVQEDVAAINALHKQLEEKIALAKQNEIDISNLSGSNKQPFNKTDRQTASNNNRRDHNSRGSRVKY